MSTFYKSYFKCDQCGAVHDAEVPWDGFIQAIMRRYGSSISDGVKAGVVGTVEEREYCSAACPVEYAYKVNGYLRDKP